MQLSGDGTGGDAGEGACSWRLGIGGHTVAVLLDYVKHPLAERLGHRRAGEHGEKVAAAEGENAGFLRASLCREGDDGGHGRGEFVGMAGVEVVNTIWLTVS